MGGARGAPTGEVTYVELGAVEGAVRGEDLRPEGVDDRGEVLIYATDQSSAQRATAMVQRAAGVLKIGKCYRGSVTGVKDFGVFVRINAVNEGLVPIEELEEGHTQRAGDVASEGDEMIVAVLGADDRGRLRLSRRQALGVSDSQIEF